MIPVGKVHYGCDFKLGGEYIKGNLQEEYRVMLELSQTGSCPQQPTFSEFWTGSVTFLLNISDSKLRGTLHQRWGTSGLGPKCGPLCLALKLSPPHWPYYTPHAFA